MRPFSTVEVITRSIPMAAFLAKRRSSLWLSPQAAVSPLFDALANCHSRVDFNRESRL